MVCAAHDFADRFGERLPLIEGDAESDLLGTGSTQLADLAKNGGLVQGRNMPPALEGALCRREGPVEVRSSRVRQLADDGAGGRIKYLLFVPTPALQELSVDIEAEPFVSRHVGNPSMGLGKSAFGRLDPTGARSNDFFAGRRWQIVLCE